MFLDGYPNDGSCMVDPETQKVMDYNTTDTAKAYFGKLNEEYKKGIVDPFEKIQLNKYGRFEPEFPDGFFDATLAELIEME